MASPDVSGFKFGGFPPPFFFLQMSIVDIPTQILLTLFDLHCLIPILQELSIYPRRFLFGMSTDVNSQSTLKQKVRSVKNNMVSKIWVGVSNANNSIVLIQNLSKNEFEAI